MKEETKKILESIRDSVPKDIQYRENIQDYVYVLEDNNDFDTLECTIKITTRKKGKIISTYNYGRDSKWLGKIIELPDDWDKSKLFYGQLLYCRIFLNVYETPQYYVADKPSNIAKGYKNICVEQATARKYPCDTLKECNFIDDRLGIKPYKHIYFYDPFDESFYIKAPEYVWHTTLEYCPCCGKKL